jgi:hypothetical protein
VSAPSRSRAIFKPDLVKKPRALDWAFAQQLRYASMKLLLLIMARRGNSGFHTWMTIATMASETGLSEVTVRKDLKRLLACGLILECEPKSFRGGFQTRQFRLLVPGADFGSRPPKLLSESPAKTETQNLKPSESEKNQAARAAGLPKGERRKSSTYGSVQIGRLIDPAIKRASLRNPSEN